MFAILSCLLLQGPQARHTWSAGRNKGTDLKVFLVRNKETIEIRKHWIIYPNSMNFYVLFFFVLRCVQVKK